MTQASNFLKHNNAVPIVLFLLFGMTSASFASPNVRSAMYESTEEVVQVDNTYIVSADVEDRDFKMRVTQIKEDTEMYYVTYKYEDISIVDYVWQETTVTGEMKVSKKELEGRDLGLFIAKQLAELVESKRAYFADVQEHERKKGASPKVVATKYKGIIGKFLDSEEKQFPGYAAVIAPVASSYNNPVPDDAPIAAAKDTGERSVSYPAGQMPLTQTQLIEQLVAAQVRAILSGTTTASTTDAHPDTGSGGGSSLEPISPSSSDATTTPPSPTTSSSTPDSTPPATSTPPSTEDPVTEPAPLPIVTEPEPLPTQPSPQEAPPQEPASAEQAPDSGTASEPAPAPATHEDPSGTGAGETTV